MIMIVHLPVRLHYVHCNNDSKNLLRWVFLSVHGMSFRLSMYIYRYVLSPQAKLEQHMCHFVSILRLSYFPDNYMEW